MSPEDMKKLWRRQVPRVREYLLQLQRHAMLPAIWFIFSRRGCDTAVTYVNDPAAPGRREQAEVNEALRAFHAQQPEAVRKGCAAALLRGVAAHHAGCLPAWKGFIEELYQRGLIKVSLLPATALPKAFPLKRHHQSPRLKPHKLLGTLPLKPAP